MQYNSNTTTNFNSRAEAALAYASHGLKVFPCLPKSKAPATKHGFKDGTTDVEQIKAWWRANPDYNIAIPTGEVNGFVVFDDDAPDKAEAYGTMPKTPCVYTSLTEDGQQKRQFWFALPGFEVKSTANFADVQGFDSRGEGGYVLVPPSVHPSGSVYSWHIPLSEPLAPAPAWLLAMLPRCQEQKPKKEGSEWGKVVLKPQEDFTSHPGAKEGSRNEAYKRLVGIHFARGESQEDTLRLALAWAERCNPPYPEEELRKQVASSFANLRKPEHSPASPKPEPDAYDGAWDEPLPMPEPEPYPVLDADAFYGIAGELVRYVEPETEASPAAILLSLLTMFGNAVGRKPHFVVEGSRHYANLFVGIVGTSADAKQASLSRAKSLMPDDAWKKTCIASGLSSGQGLIERVADGTMEPVKERGVIIGLAPANNGVQDKRLMLCEEEMARVISTMGQKDNILSSILRLAWDTGDLFVLNRGDNALRATGAHISIIAHITPAELLERLSKTDCANGFANRFLWAKCKRSKFLADGGGMLELAAHHKRLADMIGKASQMGQLQRDDDAKAYWAEIYPSLCEAKPGVYGSVVSRARAQMLRLSMLYALLDRSSIIGVKHLQAAHALWQFCDASAQMIFGSAYPPLQMKVLQHIKAKPGCNRRELHKACCGHLSASQLTDALTYLVQHRLAYAKTESRCERWYPVEPRAWLKAEIAFEDITESEQPNSQCSQCSPALMPSPESMVEAWDETTPNTREPREHRVKREYEHLSSSRCNTSADDLPPREHESIESSSVTPASAPSVPSGSDNLRDAIASQEEEGAMLKELHEAWGMDYPPKPKPQLSMVDLLQECNRRGIKIRKSEKDFHGQWLWFDDGFKGYGLDDALREHQPELLALLFGA